MEDLVRKIKHENFLRPSRRERFRTFLPIAYYAPAFLLGKLVLLLTRTKDPEKAADFFRENSRGLLAAQAKEKNPEIKTLYIRMAELNDLGIDQVQTIKDCWTLSKQCAKLKHEAGSNGSGPAVEQFLQSADKLYNARERIIDISKKKIDQQIDVVEAMDKLGSFSKKDAAKFAIAGAVDSVTSTHIASSAVLGDVSAKYSINQIGKTMMSPKTLRRSIQLTELCQQRYREWKSELKVPKESMP